MAPGVGGVSGVCHAATLPRRHAIPNTCQGGARGKPLYITPIKMFSIDKGGNVALPWHIGRLRPPRSFFDVADVAEPTMRAILPLMRPDNLEIRHWRRLLATALAARRSGAATTTYIRHLRTQLDLALARALNAGDK